MLRNSLIRRPINPIATTDPLEAFSRRWLGLNDTPWFGTEWSRTPTFSWPQADLSEDENGWSIELDLPGIDKKDVQIRLERDVLTIAGERKGAEHNDSRSSSDRSERWFGRFSRSFVLPRAADADQIVAKFDNGVLSIQVPKSVEAKPRQIAVH